MGDFFTKALNGIVKLAAVFLVIVSIGSGILIIGLGNSSNSTMAQESSVTLGIVIPCIIAIGGIIVLILIGSYAELCMNVYQIRVATQEMNEKLLLGEEKDDGTINLSKAIEKPVENRPTCPKCGNIVKENDVYCMFCACKLK